MQLFSITNDLFLIYLNNKMNFKSIQSIALLAILSALYTDGLAQHAGWHLKDKQVDDYWGISLDKAYDFLKSTGRKPHQVIVGVVDSGIDTAHVDLKNVLWVNPKDLTRNGEDEDKNGYKDDIHGWNFISNRDGGSVTKDSYELARFYWTYKTRFETLSLDKVKRKDRQKFVEWQRAEQDINRLSNTESAKSIRERFDVFVKADSIVRKAIGKDIFTVADLALYKEEDTRTSGFVGLFASYGNKEGQAGMTNRSFLEGIGIFFGIEKATMGTKPPLDYRRRVLDDKYDDIKDKYYGSGILLINAKSAEHGTHVAGIIAAERNNEIGIDGVADQVRILAVRAIPDGDEHDKDVALAIRYAVDRGAKVINMSFGKAFSPDKKWVDEAVKYAQKKSVLLVHAAGNDAKNVDEIPVYPTAYLLSGKKITNWITVGASGDSKLGNLAAHFSNYGKNKVDVFAPGVQIYSTFPGVNPYASLDGTSMAAPIVSGIAALLLSYYPELTAVQVKQIIEKSVRIPDAPVFIPGQKEAVSLHQLCRTGGIVNAFDAVQLAEKIVKQGK